MNVMAQHGKETRESKRHCPPGIDSTVSHLLDNRTWAQAKVLWAALFMALGKSLLHHLGVYVVGTLMHQYTL